MTAKLSILLPESTESIAGTAAHPPASGAVRPCPFTLSEIRIRGFGTRHARIEGMSGDQTPAPAPRLAIPVGVPR